MLAVFCARPRPCILPSFFYALAAASSAAPFHLLRTPHPHPLPYSPDRSFQFAASIWHTLLPSYRRRGRSSVLALRHHHHAVKPGEGSWNVAWDTRPARWLHHPDSAWLLFGVSASLAVEPEPEPSPETSSTPADELVAVEPCNYKVTGVVADGRCLFRAIARTACLRKGEGAPDEDHERELADELRAQVVEELLQRRKEVELFIEEDFDAYVKRIQKPHVWGGEPELHMASHVLRTPISVYMKDPRSEDLKNIANYGEEYGKGEENAINVFFHGYGHYDILETIPESR